MPSPATHSSYITSNSSICVIWNEAELGLWIAGPMCYTVTELEIFQIIRVQTCETITRHV